MRRLMAWQTLERDDDLPPVALAFRSSAPALELLPSCRSLAYEIKKRHEGIYAVVDLTSPPEAVAELDRQLKLNEAVLRTKVLCREDLV
jgi:hypothetical protein